NLGNWLVVDPLLSYGRGRELPCRRHKSLIYGPDFTDVIIKRFSILEYPSYILQVYLLWANLVKEFISNSVDGIWNDMNEPAVFKACFIINLWSVPNLLVQKNQKRNKGEKQTLDLCHRILLFAIDTIKLAVASEIRGRVTSDARDAILADIQEQVSILNSTFSRKESDRAAAKRATHALSDLAKNEEVVNVIVDGGAIPALVQHLQAPLMTEEDLVQKLLPFEHEVEKGSIFALGLLSVQNLYSFNTNYGSEHHLKALLAKTKQHKLRSIADIVSNHRVGTTQGRGGIYNRFDGIPLSWDERAVTSDTGGLGNRKTGAIFQGFPNIDHTQDFVLSKICEKIYRSNKAIVLCMGVLGFLQLEVLLWTITREAVKGEFWRLRDGQGKPPGVMGWWPSRSVTFVDNHDTGSTQ
ncbi:hypothetical protein S83_058891, partial [Arachis hypogaea]